MSDDTTPKEIAVVEVGGEPRARDLDIAERLGMSRPRDIRKILARHRGALEQFGPLVVQAGEYRGRKTEEFQLNEEQALYTATVSDAPNAPAVRSMLIRTFVAWRRGHLDNTIPADVMEMLRRTDGIARQLSGKVAGMERQLAAICNQNPVPALDFGGTVSAYQIIEMAGISPEDRQRGTAQMVTKRLISFCAERRIACFKTPAEVNPSRPFRFTQDMAGEWLLGESKGLELIRNQVDRMKARKAARGRKTGQTALHLVAPQPQLGA